MSLHTSLAVGQAILWKAQDFADLELFRSSKVSHTYPRHSHPVYAIGAIEVGVGFHCARGVKRLNHPGCLVLLNPEEVHGGSAHGGPCSYRMFYISQAEIAACLPNGVGLPHFQENVVENALLAKRFLDLHDLLERSVDAIERQTAFFSVLSDFLNPRDSCLEVNPRQEHTAIGMVTDYLYAHYSQNIQIEELAQLTQLHRAYLMRLFMAHTGLTIHAFLTQIRIEMAKRALGAGQSAADVALQVGFADQSHLIRLFKRYTGTTPTKYALRSLVFYPKARSNA